MIQPIGPRQPAPRSNARTGSVPPGGGDSPLEARSDHGGVVRYGSLEVPAAHVDEFETAASYLGRDPGMRAILDKAQHQAQPLRIAVNSNNDDSYDPSTRTVNWDPYSALRTTDGGRQSPALGLGHELDHATADPGVRAAGSWRYVADYDTAEERRVIQGSETRAARTLGEDIRHDHGGTPYDVSSPILRRLA